MSVTAQHMAVLRQLSNRERLGRKELKRALRAAELSLSAALVDPRARRLSLEQLLGSQWGWGARRVQETLAAMGRMLWGECGVPQPGETLVGDLTDRQREALLRACSRRSVEGAEDA